MSSSPCFLDPVVIPRICGETVLDVACGYGRWGALIFTNFWEAGMTKPPAVDGLDGFDKNVEFCQKSPFYRKVWQQMMPSALDGQWDTVLACEFIEHLPEADAHATLDILEKAARRRIIISTPNFSDLRGGAESALGFNELDAHLSYISRSQLKARGYTVVGAGVGNPDNAISRLANKARVGWMIQGLPRALPALGLQTVAWKDVG